MTRISDREWIRARLERNRPWTAYALADLEPGYYEKTAWFCDPAGLGLTLLYRGYSRPLIFCLENSSHLASVLDEMEGTLDHPERYLVCSPENVELLRQRYRILEERPMIRMVLDRQHSRPRPAGVMRLGPGHLANLQALYTESPPEFFLDSMLTDGIYFGLYELGDLVSVAGTHIVSPGHAVGGLGNIYTRADRRSRGYATLVTSAVTAELVGMGISTIVLNVHEGNDAAIRVYDRIGYRTFSRYFELTATPAR